MFTLSEPLGPVTLEDIIRAWTALQCYPKKIKNRFRLFDGETPMAMHSIHAMANLAMECELPNEIRILGQHVLLLHDVKEDTTCGLPEGIHPDIARFVEEMTFQGGSAVEFAHIWDRHPLSWVFKLYDKASNLTDGLGTKGWMRPRGRDYAKIYLDFTFRLLARVESEVLPKISSSPIELKIAGTIRSLAI